MYCMFDFVCYMLIKLYFTLYDFVLLCVYPFLVAYTVILFPFLSFFDNLTLKLPVLDDVAVYFLPLTVTNTVAFLIVFPLMSLLFFL